MRLTLLLMSGGLLWLHAQQQTVALQLNRILHSDIQNGTMLTIRPTGIDTVFTIKPGSLTDIQADGSLTIWSPNSDRIQRYSPFFELVDEILMPHDDALSGLAKCGDHLIAVSAEGNWIRSYDLIRRHWSVNDVISPALYLNQPTRVMVFPDLSFGVMDGQRIHLFDTNRRFLLSESIRANTTQIIMIHRTRWSLSEGQVFKNSTHLQTQQILNLFTHHGRVYGLTPVFTIQPLD